MPAISRRQLIKSAAGLACAAALPGFASTPASAAPVHDLLNALIKKYSDAAKAAMANADIKALFEKDGFRDYLDVYPVGDLAGGFVWKPGMGASFTGPYSKLQIKAVRLTIAGKNYDMYPERIRTN